MAQTGTTFTLQSTGTGTYQGRYMKLTCTSSQDIANNKTNISWKLESIGGSSGHYATICRVYFSWYVNGTKKETCVYSIDKGYKYDAFPVTKGSTTGSTSVTMDNGGNKTITIYMETAVWYSSTHTDSDTWQLDRIPRQPSITGFTVDKVWQNSTQLKFNWSADSTIRYAEFSVDDGATWRGQDVNSNSGEYYYTGLASNTWYGCKIRLTRSDSGLNSTSGTYWQVTYPQPSANIWTENIGGYNGLSQIKVNWSSNINIARVGFSKDNGANYTYFDVNTTSGNYTYTGLTEGQYYNFRISVEASDGHCISVSGTSSRATHSRVRGNLYVNNTLVATNNWQGGVELKNGDTLEIRDIVNGANCSYKLFFENPDNQHQYLSATQTGTTAVSMSAEKINERLQYMKTTNSQDFNVGLVTLNGSGQHALYYEFFGTIRVVNSNPTFDENRWTYQDTNATTVALTGSSQILVNGFSKLRVSVNTAARGENYAEIKQYIVSGCTSGSSTTTGNIDCATATNGGTITVTAKDSRGNSTPTTRNTTYKDYFVPTLTSISATRNNGGVGTQTSMTFNGTWWNANFGASANTLTAVYRYKSGSTWSEARAITLTTSENTYSFNTNQLYGDLNADGFTLGTTFTIEVTITDALNGGKSWTTVLNSGTPAIAISGNNIAVGSQYDTNKGGKIQINNGELGAINVTSNDLAFKQTSTQTGKAIGFGVGGGGTNRGCWDFVKSQWLWYDNDSNLILNKFTRIPGAAGDKPLMVRGIAGCDGTATTAGELHLNYGVDAPVKIGKDATTYVQASGMIRGQQAGSWVKDRDNSLVRNAYNGDGAYAPVICQGTKTGSWTVGCLSGEDSLTFNFETDTKYNNNDNTAQRYTLSTGGYFSGNCNGSNWANWGKTLQTNGRITNANIAHSYENDKAHVQLLQASGSMTSNKPYRDGYILHFSWDNAGQYNGQLFVPDGIGHLQYRGCTDGTWGGWENIHPIKVLYDNASGTTGTVTLSESAANFSYLEIFYGKNNAELAHSTKIAVGITTGASLIAGYANAQRTFAQIQFRVVNVSGNSITNNSGYNNGGGNYYSNPGVEYYNSVETRIYRVIGYR